MSKEYTLETLLKYKKISQKTYDKVKIAKQYIEAKYNLKSVKNTEYNAIIEKINSLEISDDEKLKILSEMKQLESDHLRKSRQKQTIHDYESLTIIGRGAFGEVHVCREKKNRKNCCSKKNKKRITC